jgi:hypothetical protein
MPKRTRSKTQDINQFAADVLRQTIQEPGPVDLSDKAAISQVMRAMGRRGGKAAAAILQFSSRIFAISRHSPATR